VNDSPSRDLRSSWKTLFLLFIVGNDRIREMRRCQKHRVIRGAVGAGLILVALISSAVPTQGLTRGRPEGAVRISAITTRKSNGVLCAFHKGEWVPGTRLKRTWFISYRQQAKNYSKQARRSRAKSRTELERQAGSAALKALRLQPRCSRLSPPPSPIPSLPTSPPNSQGTPGTQQTSSTAVAATDPDNLVFPDFCPTQIEPAWDIRNGVGAGELVQALACGEARPLVASGAPIRVGVLTPETPEANFSEFYAGIEVASAYINTRLGGVGANVATGAPGRPIELIKCVISFIQPATHVDCANSLVASGVDVVISTLTYYESHRPILAAAGIKEIVGVPQKVSDYSDSAIRSLGSSGCMPLNASMIDYVARTIGATSFSLAMAWSPSSTSCYDVGAVTAANVLTGQVASTSEFRNSLPGFAQTGVALRLGATDMSTIASALVASGAQVYGLNAQGLDCTRLLSELIRQGWTASNTKMIISSACYESSAFANFGTAVEDVVLVGLQSLRRDVDRVGLLAKEYELLQKYLDLFLANPAYRGLELLDAGFVLGLRFWQASNAAVQQGSFSGSTLFAAIDKFDQHVAFGGGRLSCAEPPYASACDVSHRAYRYKGGRLEPLGNLFSGIDLLAGTNLYGGALSERRLLN
jgi:hypothetical protein